MKTKITRVGKSSLSVILAIMMIFSTLLVGMVSVSAATTTFYLDLASVYQGNESFSVWSYGGTSDGWGTVTEVDSAKHIYSVDVPSDNKSVIFLRSQSDSSNSWNNEWGRSETTLPGGTNDIFVTTGYQTDSSNILGYWDTYNPDITKSVFVTGDAATGWGKWTKLDTLSEDKTIAYTTINRGSEFKVSAAASYNNYTGISIDNTLGDDTISGEFSTSTNLSVKGSGSIYLCVELATGKIFANSTVPGTVVEEATVKNWYITSWYDGLAQSWAIDESRKITGDTGAFSFSTESTATCYFRMVAELSDGTYYTYKANDTTFTAGTGQTLVKDAKVSDTKSTDSGTTQLQYSPDTTKTEKTFTISTDASGDYVLTITEEAYTGNYVYFYVAVDSNWGTTDHPVVSGATQVLKLTESAAYAIYPENSETAVPGKNADDDNYNVWIYKAKEGATVQVGEKDSAWGQTVAKPENGACYYYGGCGEKNADGKGTIAPMTISAITPATATVGENVTLGYETNIYNGTAFTGVFAGQDAATITYDVTAPDKTPVTVIDGTFLADQEGTYSVTATAVSTADKNITTTATAKEIIVLPASQASSGSIALVGAADEIAISDTLKVLNPSSNLTLTATVTFPTNESGTPIAGNYTVALYEIIRRAEDGEYHATYISEKSQTVQCNGTDATTTVTMNYTVPNLWEKVYTDDANPNKEVRFAVCLFEGDIAGTHAGNINCNTSDGTFAETNSVLVGSIEGTDIYESVTTCAQNYLTYVTYTFYTANAVTVGAPTGTEKAVVSSSYRTKTDETSGTTSLVSETGGTEASVYYAAEGNQDVVFSAPVVTDYKVTWTCVDSDGVTEVAGTTADDGTNSTFTVKTPAQNITATATYTSTKVTTHTATILANAGSIDDETLTVTYLNADGTETTDIYKPVSGSPINTATFTFADGSPITFTITNRTCNAFAWTVGTGSGYAGAVSAYDKNTDCYTYTIDSATSDFSVSPTYTYSGKLSLTDKNNPIVDNTVEIAAGTKVTVTAEITVPKDSDGNAFTGTYRVVLFEGVATDQDYGLKDSYFDADKSKTYIYAGTSTATASAVTDATLTTDITFTVPDVMDICTDGPIVGCIAYLLYDDGTLTDFSYLSVKDAETLDSFDHLMYVSYPWLTATAAVDKNAPAGAGAYVSSYCKDPNKDAETNTDTALASQTAIAFATVSFTAIPVDGYTVSWSFTDIDGYDLGLTEYDVELDPSEYYEISGDTVTVYGMMSDFTATATYTKTGGDTPAGVTTIYVDTSAYSGLYVWSTSFSGDSGQLGKFSGCANNLTGKTTTTVTYNGATLTCAVIELDNSSFGSDTDFSMLGIDSSGSAKGGDQNGLKVGGTYLLTYYSTSDTSGKGVAVGTGESAYYLCTNDTDNGVATSTQLGAFSTTDTDFTYTYTYTATENKTLYLHVLNTDSNKYWMRNSSVITLTSDSGTSQSEGSAVAVLSPYDDVTYGINIALELVAGNTYTFTFNDNTGEITVKTHVTHVGVSLYDENNAPYSAGVTVSTYTNATTVKSSEFVNRSEVYVQDGTDIVLSANALPGYYVQWSFGSIVGGTETVAPYGTQSYDAASKTYTVTITPDQRPADGYIYAYVEYITAAHIDLTASPATTITNYDTLEVDPIMNEGDKVTLSATLTPPTDESGNALTGNYEVIYYAMDVDTYALSIVGQQSVTVTDSSKIVLDSVMTTLPADSKLMYFASLVSSEYVSSAVTAEEYSALLYENNSKVITDTADNDEYPPVYSTIQPAQTKWYLFGDNFGGWVTETQTLADLIGYELIYDSATGYYSTTVAASSLTYFKLHDGTTQYSGDDSTTKDYTIALNTNAPLVANETKSFEFSDATATGNVTIFTDGTTVIILPEGETPASNNGWIQLTDTEHSADTRSVNNQTFYIDANTVDVANTKLQLSATVTPPTNSDGSVVTGDYVVVLFRYANTAAGKENVLMGTQDVQVTADTPTVTANFADVAMTSPAEGGDPRVVYEAFLIAKDALTAEQMKNYDTVQAADLATDNSHQAECKSWETNFDLDKIEYYFQDFSTVTANAQTETGSPEGSGAYISQYYTYDEPHYDAPPITGTAATTKAEAIKITPVTFTANEVPDYAVLWSLVDQNNSAIAIDGSNVVAEGNTLTVNQIDSTVTSITATAAYTQAVTHTATVELAIGSMGYDPYIGGYFDSTGTEIPGNSGTSVIFMDNTDVTFGAPVADGYSITFELYDGTGNTLTNATAEFMSGDNTVQYLKVHKVTTDITVKVTYTEVTSTVTYSVFYNDGSDTEIIMHEIEPGVYRSGTTIPGKYWFKIRKTEDNATYFYGSSSATSSSSSVALTGEPTDVNNWNDKTYSTSSGMFSIDKGTDQQQYFVYYKPAAGTNGNGALYVVQAYLITYVTAENVLKCPEPAYAAVGENVTIAEYTLESGYAITDYTVSDGSTVTDNGDGTYSFTMPAQDVTVTPTTEAKSIEYTAEMEVKDTDRYVEGRTTFGEPDNRMYLINVTDTPATSQKVNLSVDITALTDSGGNYYEGDYTLVIYYYLNYLDPVVDDTGVPHDFEYTLVKYENVTLTATNPTKTVTYSGSFPEIDGTKYSEDEVSYEVVLIPTIVFEQNYDSATNSLSYDHVQSSHAAGRDILHYSLITVVNASAALTTEGAPEGADAYISNYLGYDAATWNYDFTYYSAEYYDPTTDSYVMSDRSTNVKTATIASGTEVVFTAADVAGYKASWAFTDSKGTELTIPEADGSGTMPCYVANGNSISVYGMKEDFTATATYTESKYFTVGDTIYFDAGNDWWYTGYTNLDNTWAKFYENGTDTFKWVKLTVVDPVRKILSCTVPEGNWDQLKFARVDTNNFDSTVTWNASTVYNAATVQSPAQKGTNNLFKITNTTGSMEMNGEWSMYEPPKFALAGGTSSLVAGTTYDTSAYQFTQNAETGEYTVNISYSGSGNNWFKIIDTNGTVYGDSETGTSGSENLNDHTTEAKAFTLTGSTTGDVTKNNEAPTALYFNDAGDYIIHLKLSGTSYVVWAEKEVGPATYVAYADNGKTTYTMTETYAGSNIYVSNSTMDSSWWFKVQKTENGTVTYTNSASNGKELTTTELKVSSWDSDSNTGTNSYKNALSEAAYVAYNATTDMVYLITVPAVTGAEVYAKNGTIHTETGYENTTRLFGDTVILNETPLETNTAGYKRYDIAPGTVITIQTTINDAYYKIAADGTYSGYYVEGFVVNGETCRITYKKGNVYQAEYTVPEGTAVGTKIEITPVYYNTNADYVTVYIDASELPADRWGSTLALYTYYYKGGTDTTTKEMDGNWPGQPLLKTTAGTYYAKVAKQHIDGAGTADYYLDGIVINNYGNDTVHNMITGQTNKQTYDFGDLLNIIAKGYDTARFEIKFRETISNKTTLGIDSSYNVTKTFDSFEAFYNAFAEGTGNGWNTFTYYDKTQPVDIFGNAVDNTKGKIYIVSTAEHNTEGKDYQTKGAHATMWYIFDSNAKLITFGTPADFIGDESGNATAQMTTMQSYAGYAVEITYEKTDGTRLDGRWYFTNSTSDATITVIVQYGDGTTWTDDTLGEYGTATIDGETSKTFTEINITAQLEAKSTLGSGYVFDSWAVYNPETGLYETKEGLKANDTYTIENTATLVARFKEVATGTIVLSHDQKSGSAAGNFYISATLYNSTGDMKNSVTDSQGAVEFAIDSTDTKIEITLTTRVSGANAFDAWYKQDIDGSYYPFADVTEPVVTDRTVSYTFEVSIADIFNGTSQIVKSLTYFSNIIENAPQATLNFKYKDRNNVVKTFTVIADLDDNYLDADGYAYTLVNANGDLTAVATELIYKSVPAVQDLYKDLVWTVNSEVSTVKGVTFTLTAQQSAKSYKVTIQYDGKAAVDEYGVAYNSLLTDSTLITADNPYGYKYTATKEGFSYWSVTANGVEVARCYSPSFNLRIVDHYTITAVYNDAASSAFAYISQPSYTREQYTENGTNYDYLYADFLLAYTDSTGTKLSGSGYKTGLIVEIDRNTLTSGTATSFSDSTADQLKAVTELANGKNTSYTTDGSTRIAYNYVVSNSAYNNMNRLDYYLRYVTNAGISKYLMKVYYYVKDPSGNITYSTPVYMNLAEAAKIAANTDQLAV